MLSMISRGWEPPYLWNDPVIWNRREANVIAEYLVKYTMNERRTWIHELVWPLPGIDHAACNYLVHSDGGTRKDQCSAAGWIVEVLHLQDGVWSRDLLARGGNYIHLPVSSFLAESIGLEESTFFLRRFFERCGLEGE